MYALSDEVISQIAKLIQLAIITGTDVVDNLRTIRVEASEETGQLSLTDEYRQIAESQIEKLLSEMENASEEEIEV